jgi:mediator of RNA polymerase II transcription subunit 12
LVFPPLYRAARQRPTVHRIAQPAAPCCDLHLSTAATYHHTTTTFPLPPSLSLSLSRLTSNHHRDSPAQDCPTDPHQSRTSISCAHLIRLLLPRVRSCFLSCATSTSHHRRGAPAPDSVAPATTSSLFSTPRSATGRRDGTTSMTTRPNLGQRPPSRSLSANLLQRPAAPSSPSRRSTDTLVDVTFEGPDAVLPRYGLPPRNAGSRLKLETSRDSPSATTGESTKSSLQVPPVWKPPRGRPQLHFDVPSIRNPGPRTAQEGDRAEVVINPMPLPVRPGHHPRPTGDRTRVEPGNTQKKDARPKPYILEVPAAAARYSPNSMFPMPLLRTHVLTLKDYADFFPWTGNHPEDKFSENAIRQGFYDKAQLTQNETGSAKSSVLPPLKHKSGLQTLSSLFTTVLAQRRAYGQITSNSTFKPPPRVTVTDTKREMWLKDLANPAISLRRLSRSIPHGIRGKVLLDQSLSKSIPIERAVWLAKCVGANELRSFRRKGASGLPMVGEGKWIREFTVCVEQFVESIVESCGEKDFRSRVNYA